MDQLRQAISLQGDAQVQAFAQLSALFESTPEKLLPIYSTITGLVTDPRVSQAARWAATVMQFGLSGAKVAAEMRQTLALQSIPPIARLIADNDLRAKKIGLQCFASIYPLLFKHACLANDQQLWTHVLSLKTSALLLWRTGTMGAKVSAIKVIQRIIQTQTRAPADPRLRLNNEPNLNLCRANHPFLRPNLLEDEANKLLEELITSLFTSKVPDIVSTITLALSALVKVRPAFANLVITALTNWSPEALLEDSTAAQVRSVEKSVKVSLTHLYKTAHANAYASQVSIYLAQQESRMAAAYSEAKRLRELEASRTRALLAEDIDTSSSTANKRRKVDTADAAALFEGVGRRYGVNLEAARFDVKQIPVQGVVEMLVETLQRVPNEILTARIADAERDLPVKASAVAVAAEEAPEAQVKVETVDPLKLDLGEEELDMKAEVPVAPQAGEEEEPEVVHTATFDYSLDAQETAEFLASKALSTATKTAMIESAMRRICAAGTEGIAPAIWAPLVARLITRGLRRDDEVEDDQVGEERRETLRRIVFEFVVSDAQSRMEFARLWLNEEWFVEGHKSKEESANRPYDKWLGLLLDHMITFSSNKDKSFAQFLVDLPELPSEEISRIGDMCTNRDQFELGFVALRDLALLRPPVRAESVDVLLGLATHAERATRLPAVNTVKRWYPDSKALGEKVVTFAISLIKRLESPPPPPPSPPGMDMSTTPEPEEEGAEVKPEPMAELPRPYAKVKDGFVVDRLNIPTTSNEMLQHLDLYFALCVKDPDLLDHIFRYYPAMQPFAQDAIREMIAPLIKSLGIAHPKISDLTRNCPEGADPLLVRTFQILLEKLRPPKNIIEDIKYLATQRELSARLYVMVIADFSKADIMRYLPKVVTLLNNSPEEKAIVRSAFLSVIAPPGQAANAARSRQADQLMPVELITVLHKSEAVAGVKPTIEAIGICFSMPDAFRPEILAAFMTQVVEEPVLPVLFLRTVIQAVNTYKMLATFVSTTLLTRLIAKEIWTTGPLWEGFIRLAKAVMPQSFAALCLLPPEKVRDLVEKQPGMKDALREYVMSKYAKANPTKGAVLMDVLGPPPPPVVEEGMTEDEYMGMREPQEGEIAMFV